MLSLEFLNIHDHIYAPPDVKGISVLSELTCFDLRIIKEVFYVHQEQMRTTGLHIVTFADLRLELLKMADKLRVQPLAVIFDQVEELLG